MANWFTVAPYGIRLPFRISPRCYTSIRGRLAHDLLRAGLHIAHFRRQRLCAVFLLMHSMPTHTLLATLGFERSGGCFFGYAGGQPPHNMTTPTTMNGQPTLATLFIRPMYQATNASPT